MKFIYFVKLISVVNPWEMNSRSDARLRLRFPQYYQFIWMKKKENRERDWEKSRVDMCSSILYNCYTAPQPQPYRESCCKTYYIRTSQPKSFATMRQRSTSSGHLNEQPLNWHCVGYQVYLSDSKWLWISK